MEFQAYGSQNFGSYIRIFTVLLLMYTISYSWKRLTKLYHITYSLTFTMSNATIDRE